ncbi:YqzE family protein [Cohnella suwonensis]|uniref:YqzE family protein n=1 Tax=Cohnella suwonensis TaxID=696072 RepID=A0ABW0LR53_9BACL
MDGSEYLKYVTERFVSYMDRPAEPQTEDREGQQPHAGKISREPWLTRWFGVAPLGVQMWWTGRAERKNKTRQEAARSVESSSYR